MSDIGVKIPFDFNDGGSAEDLQIHIANLIEETNRLRRSMMDIPIDELRKKITEYSTEIGNVGIQTMKLNQNQAEERELMLQNKSILEMYIDKMNNAIAIKKLWTLEGEKEQKALDAVNKEIIKSANSITELQSKIAALNKIKEEGGRLTKAQENQIVSYNEKLLANAKIIQDNNQILAVYNSRVKETSIEMERNIGFIAATKEQIKELTGELTGNIEVDKALVQQIADLNVVLGFYNKQIGGTLELESALNTVRENNIKNVAKELALEEVDIESKAQLIIANQKLNAIIQERIETIKTGLSVEDRAYIAYEKEVEAKKIASERIAEIEQQDFLRREAEYEKMWLQAEKNLEKETLLKIGWLNKQQAERLKELEAEQAAEEKAARSVLENELKKAEAREKGAEVAVASGKKAIWSLENVSETASRMGLRTLISFGYWTLLIGAATTLWELWTKISDAEQLAQDRLKDYFESFKSFKKDEMDLIPKTSAQIEFDRDKGNRIANDMDRYFKSGDFDKAYNKYKELMSLYPKIFDQMDIKKFKEIEEDGRMKKQLETMDKYNILLKEKSALEEQDRKILEIKFQNQDKQELAKKNIIDAVRLNKDGAYLDFSRAYYPGIESENVKDKDVKKVLDSLTDEQIISILQKKYRGKRDELPSKYNPFSGGASNVIGNTEVLNMLEIDQNTNKLKAQDLKEKIDKINPKISDMEGNPIQPKGRQPKKPHPDQIADEKDAHRLAMEDLQEMYDQSNKSFDDKKEKYRLDELEVSRHYSVEKKMIEDFNKISGETAEKQKERLDKSVADKQAEVNKIVEARQRDIQSMHEYQNEMIRLNDETLNKIEKINENSRRKVEDIQKQKKKDDRTRKRDSDTNIVGAFFGTDGSHPVQDYKDKILDINDSIEEDKKNLEQSSSNQLSKTAKSLASGIKVSQDAMTPDNKKSGIQLIDSKQNLEQYNKDLSEKENADNRYASDFEKLRKDQADKTKTENEKAKEQKVAIAHASFEATEKIANSSFDAAKRRIQKQMNDVQGLANFEMQLAGNNSAAKIRIAQVEHNKMLELKRQQAKVDKEQGIFSATISTAQGVASALSLTPPLSFILAAIVAAAGAVQIANIASTSLPSYAKGRIGGRKEVARINEEGFELIERNGTYNVLGGGKDSVVQLEHGDTVHTHKESEYFLKTLLKGTGVITKKEHNERRERSISIQNMITKDDFKSAMIDAIKTMPKQEINLPAQSLQDKHSRQQVRHTW